jgi:hypothetical protein
MAAAIDRARLANATESRAQYPGFAAICRATWNNIEVGSVLAVMFWTVVAKGATVATGRDV